MLRRLNVRTRLIAVIAVPLVLLFAVSGPEILQRREDARAADRAATLAADAQQVIVVVDALQSERTLSAAHRAGAVDEVAAALANQRTATDTAIDQAGAALQRLAEDERLASEVGIALDALAGLPQIRRDTDAAESLVPWIDAFAPPIGALLAVQDRLGTSTADTGVGGDLAVLAGVSGVKDATANQAAQLASAQVWGELRGDQQGILRAFRADELALRAAYLATSPTELRNERRDEIAAGAGTSVGRTVDGVIAAGDVAPAGSLSTWLDESARRQVVLRLTEVARADEAVRAADRVGEIARQASTGYLVLAGGGLLLALALALLAARSITRPLRELTVAADHLAEERLPRLVEALRNPVDDDGNHLAVVAEPIDVRSDDELAHLARAFNAVQSVAVDVAAQQATLLRKGISDLYVNLARRNQALIDRQIQLLDRLEAGEQDSEVLEHLYLLDHLATRMRRNAESLLILAGAESGPRRSKPIDMVDVVRAALSEVEEYERVDLGSMADAVLHGPAVSDVAHLVAELLENATHFSPPDTVVRVDGTRAGAGYQLVISDRGVGIRPEQLDELNAVLSDPPVTGLALGRSLGCLVAARLAARHGITVRLRAGEREGIAAYVIVPHHLLEEASAEPLSPPTRDTMLALESSAPSEPPGPTPDPWLSDWDESQVAMEEPSPLSSAMDSIRVEQREVSPGTLSDALPARSEFDAGLRALLESTTPSSLVEPPVKGEELAPSGASAHPPSASLQRRVPGATADVLPAPLDDPPLRRSPSEVRALLSRYRSGLQAGRGSDGTEEERS